MDIVTILIIAYSAWAIYSGFKVSIQEYGHIHIQLAEPKSFILKSMFIMDSWIMHLGT